MSTIFDERESGWDRTFLDASSKMAEPFCEVWHLLCYRLVAPLEPQKFENCDTKTREIGIRVLIGSGALIGAFLTCAFPLPICFTVLALGGGSKVFRAIGFALQKEGFTHIGGEAPEKVLDPDDPQLRVMTWNICGVGGGMSLDRGGVVHWRSRIDRVIEKIRNEDADVVVLQEIYDTALSEALVERLQSEYAHFFTHLGSNVMGSVGGCMVLSKCAVHRFSNTSFENNDWTLNRGFAVLDVKASPKDQFPSARIIGTHLIHGEEGSAQAKRVAQVAQVVDRLAKDRLEVATLIAGNLNIDRNEQEETLLRHHFNHGYTGIEATCTNRLTAHWDLKAKNVWDETIDYISHLRESPGSLEACHLVKAFDDWYDTKSALSDHHAVVATLRGFGIAPIS